MPWLHVTGILWIFSLLIRFQQIKPKDGPLSQAFVTGIYDGLNPGGFSEQMLSSLTDETVFTHTGWSINTVNEGSLSPSNLGWVDGTYSWKNMYNRIRSCNMAISNLTGEGSFSDESLKKRLVGEAYFLRAYYYHQLVRYYGSVPLITKIYGLNEDYSASRNTFEECINFIVKDCDSSALLLEGKNIDKGRASKLSALALKSRVLLYAASDLHDIPTAKGKSAVISAYAHPQYLGYVSGDRNARWQAAQIAAKAVMDAGTGYKLNLSGPVSAAEGTKNYLSLSMGGGSKDKNADPSAGAEIILGKYFIADLDQGSRHIGVSKRTEWLS